MRNPRLLSTILALILAGCASSPLVNTFMDPDIPATNHAALSVHNNLVIAMIDGQMTLKSSGRGNDGVIAEKSPIVLLTPGFHTLDVQYMKYTKDIDVIGNNQNQAIRITTTTTQSSWVKFSGEFEGGRYYRFYPVVDGKTVYFQVIDESDPSVWSGLQLASNASQSSKLAAAEMKNAAKRVTTADKKIAGARAPKKLSTLIAYQKAAAEPPTVLEGTYVLRGNPDLAKLNISEQAYTFKGKSFTIVMTKNFTNRELNQQNTFRKLMDVPLLTSNTAYPAQRGIIIISGDTVTLDPLQQDGDGSSGFITIPGIASINTRFNFAFSPDGNLLLSQRNNPPLVLEKEIMR